MLASVSRSFYLSIKVLPAQVREPVGLAYLLARTTDTVADTADAPVEARLRHLAALDAMIHPGPDAAKIAQLQKEIIPADTAERELLGKIEPALRWLEAQRAEDRADIVAVLEQIIRGQSLDIRRFPDKAQVRALQDAGELDEYTWLVAGCVGEFWTRVCTRNLENYAQLRDEKVVASMGIRFGKGLQLVNILRDMPADLRAGRCYLPADELKAAGIAPSELLDAPDKARVVFDRWLHIAAANLDEGFKYIEALSNWRAKLACFLPWAIGMKTLALLSRDYPLATSTRVKVSRSEVRKLMFVAPRAAACVEKLRDIRMRLNGAIAVARIHEPVFDKK